MLFLKKVFISHFYHLHLGPSDVLSINATIGSIEDSVILTWEHGIGIRDTYTIKYRNVTLDNINGTSKTKTIQDLALNTTYKFSIFAVSNGKTCTEKAVNYTSPGNQFL